VSLSGREICESVRQGDMWVCQAGRYVGLSGREICESVRQGDM